MGRPKAIKGPPPLEDLPEPLRRAIVRLMAKYNLDTVEAYGKLAVLADQNSREFDAAVKKKAERLYKSRLMTQMNSARVSINRTANARLDEKYREGVNDGYAQGKNEHAIYYCCKVCGKPVYLTPNSDAHQAVVDAMHKLGWGHKACHEKNKRS